MTPIGNMIIIGVVTLGFSIGIIALIRWLGRQRPMKIVPFEKPAEVHGDVPHITPAEFPRAALRRELQEPRGM